MMKTIIHFTSALFLLFSLQSNITLADDPIPEVTVVGYTGGGYSGSTDMGPMNAPGQGLNSQYSITSSYGKTKMEEALKKQKYEECVTNAIKANNTCVVASSNNLASNQAICSQVGASMAGVTAGTGILLFLTGIGAVPGSLITAAAGTTGTMIYNQCGNLAKNISTNADANCAMTFDTSKLKCDAIKPQ